MKTLLPFLATMALPFVAAKLRTPQDRQQIDNMWPIDALTTRSENRGLKEIDLLGDSGTPPANSFPLQECEGDCDKDTDCDTALVCFQRGSNIGVPGCNGGEKDTSKSDYCILEKHATEKPNSPVSMLPSATVKVSVVGNNGNPAKVFPLRLCQGDCDSDNECAADLVCSERGPYEDAPGCLGGKDDPSQSDYCMPPGSAVGRDGGSFRPPSPTDIFRLKLYWEEGYYWQEETRERKWCIMHHYDGRPADGKCWYGREKKSCRDDRMYMSKCSNDQRQYFNFVELPGAEVLIKTGNGENFCFERIGTEIFLRECNSSNTRQRWYAPSGSFDGLRFEVSQSDYSSQCMTQDHHPKEAEVLELHSCGAARSPDHETSYWNLY